MNIRSALAALALGAAIVGTSFLGAMSVSTTVHAAAANAGGATIFEPIPTFVPAWENPLVPVPAQVPVFGR